MGACPSPPLGGSAPRGKVWPRAQAWDQWSHALASERYLPLPALLFPSPASIMGCNMCVVQKPEEQYKVMLQVGPWAAGERVAVGPRKTVNLEGEGQVESRKAGVGGRECSREKGRELISPSDYWLLGAGALWEPSRDGRNWVKRYIGVRGTSPGTPSA